MHPTATHPTEALARSAWGGGGLGEGASASGITLHAHSPYSLQEYSLHPSELLLPIFFFPGPSLHFQSMLGTLCSAWSCPLIGPVHPRTQET